MEQTVPRHVALALVVGARFGLLLGLALWLGLALAGLLIGPVLYRRLARPQANEIAGALYARIDKLLLAAIVVILIALGARALLDGAAPGSGILLPIAAMVGSRLIGALVVGPAGRALAARLDDANAPASDAERGAYDRLHAASVLLLTLEACLALYALFAIS